MSEVLENPFQPPADNSPPDTIPARKAWLAGLLAVLLGVMGLVYCGRLRRAIVWQLAFFLSLLLIGSCLLYSPNGRLGIALALALAVLPRLLLIVDSVRIARATETTQRKPYQHWWAYLLIYGMLVLAGNGSAYLLRSHWMHAFVVPTNGMASAVRAGDRIMVELTGPSPRTLQRGAIVAFRTRDQYSGQESIRIQRIIGLPGDTVEIVDQQVSVNGQPLDEPYATLASQQERDYFRWEPRATDLPPQTIPDGYLFMLGDNRPHSLDSRFRELTAVDDVIGIARLVYWSNVKYSPYQVHMGADLSDEGEVRWERIGQRLDTGVLP